MICPKCNANIFIINSKFCQNCGAKVEEVPVTPNLEKTVVDVRKICLNTGDKIVLTQSSSTVETKVSIEASEEAKKMISIDYANGILSVSKKEVNLFGRSQISIGRNGRNISCRDGIIIGGNISNVVMDSNSSITIDDVTIGDGPIIITISTPQGVDLDVNTSGSINCTVGDLLGKVNLKTSGGCTFSSGTISNLNANISGHLTANIKSLVNGNCNLVVSGRCDLSINSGNIGNMVAQISGRAELNIQALVNNAIINVSGRLSGYIRSNNVSKNVLGRDSLTILR